MKRYKRYVLEFLTWFLVAMACPLVSSSIIVATSQITYAQYGTPGGCVDLPCAQGICRASQTCTQYTLKNGSEGCHCV